MTLHWPRERPAGPRAIIKAMPEDFRVIELTPAGASAAADGANPSAAAPMPADAGSGEHLYLRIEKRALSTPDVARWLAHACGVPEAAVGYAGMKDKHAVTEQWFSVCTAREPDTLPVRDGVTILAAARGRRKLRRGQLAGNRFRVRLRDVVGRDWCERLAAVRDAGVPNYFGPQRFGGDNLERARAWLCRRRRRERTFRTGLHLSVLRSFLFNEVLALRVANRSWNQPLPGDVLQDLPGAPDHLAPTGPLWGRGRSAAAGAALEIEQMALAPHAGLCEGLEHTGVAQERRCLVLRAPDLCWQTCDGDVEVTFTLPPGGYATTLLGEVFDLVEGAHA